MFQQSMILKKFVKYLKISLKKDKQYNAAVCNLNNLNASRSCAYFYLISYKNMLKYSMNGL